MSGRLDAVVVGSGPNGLAAAITLARAGRRVRVYEARETVGGGTRTEELTLPGFLHDVCSAVHPLALSSPFFRSLPLEQYGLRWVHPEAPLAHPLDGEPPVMLERSLAATIRGLGEDGKAYGRLVGPFAGEWPELAAGVLAPIARVPRHPLLMARFGWAGMRPAASLARGRFQSDRARALLAGIASHAILPLERRFTSSFALTLAAAAHSVGWPFAAGGSQSIARAMASYLEVLGGEGVVSHRVASLDDLPPARAVLLDVTPRQFMDLAGGRLSGRYRNQLLGYRYGPGVFKLDYALDGPVPWASAECARAGTVHLGGGLEEIAAAERAVAEGRVPERPYVIAAQPSLFDDTRAPRGKHTLWAYCHVPHGCGADMTVAIEAQIERFAPGFRDCVIGRHAMGPAEMESHNANYVGGDIAGGSHGGLQLFFRPALRRSPYATPMEGVYLCSSSTPPGAGVHGMCGYWAAKAMLRSE